MTKNLKLLTCQIDKSNIKKTLEEISLGIEDWDFDGSNGTEYLWAEAKGFASNKEWLTAAALNYKGDIFEKIRFFIETYFAKEMFYYEQYNYSFTEDNSHIIISYL